MKKPTLLYYRMLQYQAENYQFLIDNFSVIELDNPSFDTDQILDSVEIILAPLGYKVDKAKINKAKNLKIIASNTTGHPHIDVDYAASKGIDVITLKYEREFLDSITPTAEMTWGLLIAVTRNLIPAHNYVQSGKWNRRPFGGKKMLSRMKIGIVGLGRLGRKVADYARVSGMEVFYYDPYVDCGYPGITRMHDLSEMVSLVDAVTVHIPHEKETENLFDRSLFSRFKKGSYFVNTSRGELVDHAALLEALESGNLAGAAMDVFEGEFDEDFEDKIKSHELWQYARNNDNLILTPHIGGSTYDAWYETERHTIERILESLDSVHLSSTNLPIISDAVWGVIPARGGSKTIPLKNMALLNNKPMIEYTFDTAKQVKELSRLICSTDSQKIIDFCNESNVEVQVRPSSLAQDNISTVDVILNFLDTIRIAEGVLPEYLVLFEPTSPFLKPEHVSACINVLKQDAAADSSQTVTPVASNSHAYNQRYHDENGSNFLFVEERRTCINKQLKPELFIHGNVRVMKVESLIRTRSLFGERSIPVKISRLSAMDVDGPDDLALAESIIKTGLLNSEFGA